MDINNPHDAFAKAVMSNIENARDFFNGVLPAELKQAVDLSALQEEKDSYIDETLSEYYSDIVYSCRYRENTVKLVLLFEHKSYLPKYPHFQVLRYKLNIWQWHEKNRKPPPAVIPVVLYHGTEKWAKRQLVEYLELPDKATREAIGRYTADFDYIMVNLTVMQHRQIQIELFQRSLVKIWLLIQKYIFTPNQLLYHLHSLFSIDIVELTEEEKRSFLRTVFLYLFNASGLPRDEIQKAIQPVRPAIQEGFMTAAEEFIQEGKIQEKQEVLIKLISKKFGLTEAEKTYISSVSDPDALERGIDKFVFADSKEQVLSAIKSQV